MARTFAIVGPGRVGRALVTELGHAGMQLVGIIGRDLAHSVASAERILGPHANQVHTRWPDVREAADVIFLSTPDGKIAHVAAALASVIPAGKGKEGSVPVVFHLSGALDSDVLGPLRQAGCSVGSMHPIQSLSGPDSSLKGIAWGVEGDKRAVLVATELVRKLQGKVLPISKEAKALYHAAACVASNYLVSLVDLASELMTQAGISRNEAAQALLPLMYGSLSNVERQGVPDALTGPIERGDTETVRRHLQAFETYHIREQLVELYRDLGGETLRLAMLKGSVSGKQAEDIQLSLSEQ